MRVIRLVLIVFILGLALNTYASEVKKPQKPRRVNAVSCRVGLPDQGIEKVYFVTVEDVKKMTAAELANLSSLLSLFFSEHTWRPEVIDVFCQKLLPAWVVKKVAIKSIPKSISKKE